MPKRTREDEAGPSTLKLPPLMGMDDAAGSASWGKRKEKKGKKEAAETVVEDIADDVDDVDDDEVDAEDTAASAPKQKKKKKTLTTGVVYISRLPPGMTPHKVRHLMARWGDVGRVYAQRRDAPTGYNPNHDKQKKKEKHQSANFDEAWVEFHDKNVAKTVARMLNAQSIGGKKGDRWRDDIWTMKYLSGFKWEMLGEQVAYERNVHQSRLRAEITRAKAEQNSYLKNVELARVLNKREEKRAAQPAAEGKAADDSKASKGKRNYRQREVADRAHGLEATGMENVLGNIFG